MTLVQSRLAKTINIEDLRQITQKRVPGFALAYLEGGAEDHATLRWNRQVFEGWRFVPDTLVNAENRTLETKILGAKTKFPLIVAPTGFNGMLRHRADILLAQAARDAGIPFTLSTMSSASIEDVARGAEGVDLWFQLYMLKDRSITLDLLRRAREAGCKTLVFTTDCVHFGNRESERRHFRAPMKLTLPAMFDTALHPGWVFDVIGRGRGVPGFGNLAPYFASEDSQNGRGANFVASKLDLALTWNDLQFLRDNWEGKLVIKGILHARDAKLAAGIGADAVVLTNHGGRQLDGSLSPMEALEDVRASCDSKLEIFIDSGFRRGTDIAKALALGANAVMLGRPLLYGVAAAGLPGVEKALSIITSELDRTLAQLGVTSISKLKKHHVQKNKD